MQKLQRLRVVLPALIVALLNIVFCEAAIAAPNTVTTRPLKEFLAKQGTYCSDVFNDGTCYLFVPPDKNYLGWSSDFDFAPVLFAGVDYAALSNAYPSGNLPTVSGSVTERLLADGRAEVTVSLKTHGANIWVTTLDLNGDVLAQIAGSAPTLFGHRPIEVLGGAAPAVADSDLKAVFVMPSGGLELPDLVQLNNVGIPGIVLKSLRLRAQATGPLTTAYGVAEGTPGRCNITENGLFLQTPRVPPGKALVDRFPVESIKLMVVGH